MKTSRVKKDEQQNQESEYEFTVCEVNIKRQHDKNSKNVKVLKRK
jgi:hypothetical protein